MPSQRTLLFACIALAALFLLTASRPQPRFQLVPYQGYVLRFDTRTGVAETCGLQGHRLTCEAP